MEDDIWAQYTAVWAKLVYYIYHTEDIANEDRPKYRLSKRQSKPLDKLGEIIKVYIDNPDIQPLDKDRVDRLVLRVIMALLDYRLAAREYHSAIISGLAVIGIQKDNN
jgi:hypothetical protein